jgi:hypothetical protein
MFKTLQEIINYKLWLLIILEIRVILLGIWQLNWSLTSGGTASGAVPGNG